MSEQLPILITVEEVHALRESAEAFVLLDCRTNEEHALVHLEGSVLIPMDEIPHRLELLEAHKSDRIVVYCHMGVRSHMVCQWLRGQGFTLAQTMTGGIDQWSVTIDTDLLRY